MLCSTRQICSERKRDRYIYRERGKIVLSLSWGKMEKEGGERMLLAKLKEDGKKVWGKIIF